MYLKFLTQNTEHKSLNDQPCEITRWINEPDSTHDLEVLPMAVIKIGGIVEVEVWADEIQAVDLPENEEACTALLIETLNAVKDGKTVCGIYPKDTDPADGFSRYTFLVHPLIAATSAVLIGEGGPSLKPYNALKQAGYRVFALEKDSFGWLIGGVEVPGKGVFSFG